MINHVRLKEVLSYDELTGIFTWKMDRRGGSYSGDQAGYVDSKGYLSIQIEGVRYAAHRLVWFYCHSKWPPEQVDHQNNDRLDNRLSNLRLATQGQNSANSLRRKSGLKGAYFSGRHSAKKPWFAKIEFNGRQFYLGSFKTAEEAHTAYMAAANQYFREYANNGLLKIT